MSEKKLFRTVTALIFLAIVYLFLHMYFKNEMFANTNICFFRKVTSIPCPGCGTTRAIETILGGRLIKSFLINPYGFVVLTILVLFPFWMGYDKLFSRNSFFNFYNKAEIYISKRSVMIPLILLGLINWAWNIIKYT